MASKQGTSLLSGSVEVAVAQTPVQLTTAVLKGTCIGVWVSADSGNTGKQVVVGASAASVNAKPKVQKGIGIHEFQSIFIEVDDPSKLWVDAETSGDKVTFLAVIA